MAFAKVKRGRRSSSARVATFLSTLSRHKITLQHISGASNETGYVSRNPAVCCERYCQIWDFARKPAEVLIIIAVHVESQRCRMPFLSPAAWKRSQQDCPTFRRVCSQLKQGSTPSPKETEHSGTYLSLSSIERNKLLVVRNCSEHRTLVPQHMLSGFVLLSAYVSPILPIRSCRKFSIDISILWAAAMLSETSPKPVLTAHLWQHCPRNGPNTARLFRRQPPDCGSLRMLCDWKDNS